MTVRSEDTALAKLCDQAAVRAVVEGCADGVTRGDPAAFGAFFAPEAVWTVGPPMERHVEGKDAIVAALAAPIAAMDFLIFTVSNFVISVDGDVAHSRATVHEYGRFSDGGKAYGVPALDVHALYDDELRRDGDGWLFTKRKYTFLYVDAASVPAGQAFPLA